MTVLDWVQVVDLMDKFAMRRAVWGLSGGILVSLLPYAVAKIGSNLLLPLFVLLWPGEILGLATSGWNAQLLTVCLVVITNIAFYTAVIYVVLTRLHDRNQAKRNAE